jgi:polar amino acid transport system permease protein
VGPKYKQGKNKLEFLNFFIKSYPLLLYGLEFTLIIWVSCICFGSIFGLILALGRIYGNKLIYSFCTWYIELFRGTPMLIQILLIYLGLPDIGIVLRPIIAAILAAILNTAAYQAEYFRGSIQGIKIGQIIAARSLGMNKYKAIRYIILPQALRYVIPQWSNEVIIQLKDTSLAFAIGVPELMAQAKIIGFTSFRYLEIFSIAAFFYLFIVTIVAKLLSILERMTKIPT